MRGITRLEREKNEKGRGGGLERTKAALRLVEKTARLDKGMESHLLTHGTLAWKIATLVGRTVTTVKPREKNDPIRSITLLSMTVRIER